MRLDERGYLFLTELARRHSYDPALLTTRSKRRPCQYRFPAFRLSDGVWRDGGIGAARQGRRLVRISLAQTGRWLVDRGEVPAAALRDVPKEIPRADITRVRIRCSRLELAFDLVEKAPIRALDDNLLWGRFDHAQLMQPQRIEA